MYNIFTIANWFLQQESMDHKKLQKLCYYAQAWSLALNNKRLIDDVFEGWAHGPVCRNLWNHLKKYPYYYKISSKEFEQQSEIINNTEDLKLLDRIWETYKEYDGIDLECMTHNETPWINTRSKLSNYEIGKEIINEDDMRDYYSKLYSGDGLGE